VETIRVLICKNFNRLIEASEFNQKEIAKLVGVSEVTLHRWKRGENTPDLENIEELAKVLKIDPLEFYKSENERPSPRKLTIKSIGKYLEAIPDDIYEEAQIFNEKDEVWDLVRAVFKNGKKNLNKKEHSKNHA
jgi:transcriptional regulator with XRE-family HTH domain